MRWSQRERGAMVAAFLLYLLGAKTSPLYYAWLTALTGRVNFIPWEHIFQRFWWIAGPIVIGVLAGRRGWLYGGIIPSLLYFASFFLFRPYIGSYGRGAPTNFIIFVFAMLLPITVVLGYLGSFIGARLTRASSTSSSEG